MAQEMQEPKAFGLLGGIIEERHIIISHAQPLLRNARQRDCNKQFMDGTMGMHAIPSETPLDKRGWVADPNELHSALDTFRTKGIRILGTYHMHRVAWEHDQTRDTPTELDNILAQNSRLFMFIISMVNPASPIIKAYFEGDCKQELPIIIR